MLYSVAVSSALPFPDHIAALGLGGAWAARPSGAPPDTKTTSMLLTVTSPGAPAWGARACLTYRVARTCTSAVTESGRVSHVAQPDATTDGAAGATRMPAGAAGRLRVPMSGPMWHPARPIAAIAPIMLPTRLIGLLPPGPGPGPGGDLDTASHGESWPDRYQYHLRCPAGIECWHHDAGRADHGDTRPAAIFGLPCLGLPLRPSTSSPLRERRGAK